MARFWPSGAIVAAFGAGVVLASFGNHDYIGTGIGLFAVVSGVVIALIDHHYSDSKGEGQ